MYEKNIVWFWTKWVIGIVVFVVGLSFLFSTFETIEAGEKGIVLIWGEYDRTIDPGFHVVNPISSSIITMNVRVKKYDVSASAASKDLQTVTSTVSLNYHVDPSGVGKLFQEVGLDYESQVVMPALQEAIKSATALFTAEELISKRAEVKEAMKSDIVLRAKKFNLVVDDLSITNFDFSPQFNAAIESKQVAEQNALTAENDLKRVKFEADQAIANAKAEAESTRLQVEALKAGSEIIELRKVEAMLEAAKRWDGKLPVNMYSGAPIPLLNLSK